MHHESVGCMRSSYHRQDKEPRKLARKELKELKGEIPIRFIDQH